MTSVFRKLTEMRPRDGGGGGHDHYTWCIVILCVIKCVRTEFEEKQEQALKKQNNRRKRQGFRGRTGRLSKAICFQYIQATLPKMCFQYLCHNCAHFAFVRIQPSIFEIVLPPMPNLSYQSPEGMTLVGMSGHTSFVGR